MLAGRQKVRIAIWTQVEIGRDPLYNTPIFEDQKVKDTFAELEFRRGREHVDGAGKIFSATYANFKLRYFSGNDLSTANWLICDGQEYEIVNVQPDLQNRKTVLVETMVRDINVESE